MPNPDTSTHTYTILNTHAHLYLYQPGERPPRQECVMMDVFYLLAPDSWSALWTDGQGRPSVNTHFSSSVYVCVHVWHFGCHPIFGQGSSGREPRGPFSLPICPSAAYVPRRSPPWQAGLPQWWMSTRLVSMSESSTLATCREGPCQRLPVGSAASADSVCIRNRRKTMEAGREGFHGKSIFSTLAT